MDSKVDWDGRDSSITPGLGLSVFHDFLSNLVEIIELFTRDVEEFAPFVGVDVWVGIIWTSFEKLETPSTGWAYLCKPFGTGDVAGRLISCRTWVTIKIQI